MGMIQRDYYCYGYKELVEQIGKSSQKENLSLGRGRKEVHWTVWKSPEIHQHPLHLDQFEGQKSLLTDSYRTISITMTQDKWRKRRGGDKENILMTWS